MRTTDENKAATDIYYWPCSFLLRARGFTQAFRQKPYQRLAVTVIVATDEPFELQVEDATATTAHAVILGPQTRRHSLQMPRTDSILLDVGVNHALFPALVERLQHAPMVLLDDESALLRPLREQGAELDGCAQARVLFETTIRALAGEGGAQRRLDTRVAATLNRIDALPRDELRVSALAEQAGLSASRLRALVQESLGCSLSSYLRWAAAWKTVSAWKPGLTLTHAAHEAGFHDLAHASRTFSELFGLPPSRLLDSRNVNLHPCEL